MRIILVWSAPLLAVSSLAAQALRGGDLVVTDYSLNGVYRIDATGGVLPLQVGAPLLGPAGVAAGQDRSVAVADFNSNTLFRIDAQTGTMTPIATGLGGPLRVVQLLDGDYAVTSNSSRSVLRVSPAGAVTTLASGSPLNRPFGVAIDIDGEPLVADDLGRAIYRITPAGIAVVYSGAPLRLPQGIALFPNGDYAVIDGLVDGVFRIDRATLQITTWVPSSLLGVNPEGIVTDWSGGFFVSHSGNPGGSGVRVLDALGNATALPTTGAPWTNLEDVALIPIVSGPTTLTTGPGAQFAFDLDAPRHAGAYYSLGLAASTFPGWQFPGDPRAMFLNVDAFLATTIGRDNPPVLVGWSSFFSPAGSSSAQVNLTLLPPGSLTGLVLYQQGLVLGPGLAIRGTTNVLRLRCQ